MKAKAFFTIVALGAALALTLVLSRWVSLEAATFNPTFAVTVTDTAANANSDVTTDFNIPAGDANFAAVVTFYPSEWKMTPGGDIPIGAEVGKLSSQATLGLINQPCISTLPVSFDMLNSTLDKSQTVVFPDTDGDTKGEAFEDDDGDTLVNAVEMWPDFIDRILGDAPAIRRAAGIQNVSGVWVLLQFLLFQPGATIAGRALDAALGFPSVTLLQAIGDPEAVPAPGAITDFCTPLGTANTAFGKTPEGEVLLTNPPDGAYTFNLFAASQRDADNDGWENGLDTCPFVPNQGNPREKGPHDNDEDGLDAACDPNDDELNSDQDDDGYMNRGDNCPLVANGTAEKDTPAGNQKDRDADGIGDPCDQNPTTPDGERIEKLLEQTVTIGAGPPAAATPTPAPGVTPTPTTPTPFTPVPQTPVTVTPPPIGVGSLAPAVGSFSTWAAILLGLGGLGFLGGLGTLASLLLRRKR